MGYKPIRERLLLLIGLPGRVADPVGVYADPDPTFKKNPDPATVLI